MDKARGQIEMLIKEITELKKELELLKLKKDQEIIDIVSVHKTHIGAKDDEIKAIVDKLEAQVNNVVTSFIFHRKKITILAVKNHKTNT